MKIKRLLFLLTLGFMLAVSADVQAQWGSEYYHRQGDTIQYDAQIYYHNWWEFERSYRTHYRKWRLDKIGGVGQIHRLFSYYFTSQPLEVVGIAMIQPQAGAFINGVIIGDTTLVQEYAFIFEADAGTDTIREVVSVPWLMRDARRHIHIRGYDNNPLYNNMEADCCDAGGSNWEKTLPVIEYYFDSTYTLQDSFYVGWSGYSDPFPAAITFDSNFFQIQYYYALQESHFTHNCKGEPYDTVGYDTLCAIRMPSILDLRCNCYSPEGVLLDSTITRTRNQFFGIPMVFPIIKLDTTLPPMSHCPKVENLQVFQTGGDSVVVTWDAYYTHQHGYEVNYGPTGQPSDEWSIVFSEQNQFTLGDLEPGQYYSVRVRPMCEEPCNFLREGEWCQSLTFRTADTTDVGIEPTDIARHTTLAPNPASGSVTVRCDYVVLFVDLYDAAGRHLWHQTVGSTQAILDLDGLAPGHYTMQVTTPQGTTPKHLVVQ